MGAGLGQREIQSVGIFLARQQQYSQQFKFIPPKGFVRPRWDEEGLFGAFPISVPMDNSLLVLPKHQAVLEAAKKNSFV